MAKREASQKKRRLRLFVAMPYAHPETPRLRRLLAELAREHQVELVFAHEKLTTHALLIKNVRRLVARSDFVLCFTDGQNPNVSFEAGLAVGLQKPLVLVILPDTQTLPATFMGHFYVELSGDSSDREDLRSALASIATAVHAGRSVHLPRMRCAALNP